MNRPINIIIFTTICLFGMNDKILSEELEFYNLNIKNSSIHVSSFSKNIVDSLKSYFNYLNLKKDNDSIKGLYYNDIFFSHLSFEGSQNPYYFDKCTLFYIDTINNKFHIYQKTISDFDQRYQLFSVFNNLYYVNQDYKNEKKCYTDIYKISRDSIDSIKKFSFIQQDFTYLDLKIYKPDIKIENDYFKVGIISYKRYFSILWLFFNWMPRGAPPKWNFDDSTKTKFIYTFDKDLNCISIEKVNIAK